MAALVALAPAGVALAGDDDDRWRGDPYDDDRYEQRSGQRDDDRRRQGRYNDDDVRFNQLPRAVQDTIRRETRGAQITEIERDEEHGRTHYEIEFRDGRDRYEMHVSSSGRVLLLERDG